MLIMKKLLFSILVISCFTSACKKDFDENNPNQLTVSNFWQSEADAVRGINAVYSTFHRGAAGYSRWLYFHAMLRSDEGYGSGGDGNLNTLMSFVQTDYDLFLTRETWENMYVGIYRANQVIANVPAITMDATLQKRIVAEARFLRAYEYAYMSILYGGVPLITKVLSTQEANTQQRNSLDEVVAFAIDELTSAAADLPATRPDSERGRILKAAPLAVKGRLLMIAKRWSEAAATYKEIIDLNAHIIDNRYKALFEEAGETSKEIILSTNCVAGLYGNPQNQLNYHPEFYGGYSEDHAFQGLIDAFLMTDGLPIEESPLYDPANPFDNRDPRLYASIFLPEYTEFRGRLYLAHPDKTNLGVGSLPGVTGYGWKKYVTENYVGAQNSSGDDIIHIRYAEVLLSYLESKLENGDAITQALLDETINKVRARAEVNMPPVTQTDPALLREIVRRERRVEFCLERLIRYMDIRRWGIFMEVMNQQFYGMKLTDDPENYTKYNVETTGKYRGHYKVINKTGTYTADMAFLPIPLYEIDINKGLSQNPGY